MKSFKKIFLKIFFFTSFLFEVIELTPHTYQTIAVMSTDFIFLQAVFSRD